MIKGESKVGDDILSIETGRVAKHADGSAVVSLGNTVVLTTVVISEEEREEEEDFLSLVVDYQEKAYASGKIPGGFIKREGKPSEKEILSARLIDRAIRPLFPKDYKNEIHIVTTLLSIGEKDVSSILGIIGASFALYLSPCPFVTPVGALRIAKIKKRYVINPTYQEVEESDLNLVVCGYLSSIDGEEELLVTMLEVVGKEAEEKDIIEAIKISKDYIQEIIIKQNELYKVVGKPKEKFEGQKTYDLELVKQVRNTADELNLKEAIFKKEKLKRKKAMQEVYDEVFKKLENVPVFSDLQNSNKIIRDILKEYSMEIVRQSILLDGKRVDGRGCDDIRDITCEVGILPRCHGSSLFSRGETQVLSVATLGTHEDVQIIDDVEGLSSKRFMLHYNFPPFSVKEVKPLRAPSRREIGHGALAEKALLPLIPPKEDFLYTIRVVSDVLESNGSTSMATVCGASLALFDAGVPISTAAAGISIGLVKDDKNKVHKLLVDIIGLEDDFGDMDFKIAGTERGVTAIQLDLKIPGINLAIIEEALYKAKEARIYILNNKMNKTISTPRPNLSFYAPRVIEMTIPPSKIRDVVGPSGRVIKNIIDVTGVKIDINEDGKLVIYGVDAEAVNQAKEMIEYLTMDVEVGKVYRGKVLKTTKFGAFVEVLPGKEGLVHISQLADYRVTNVEEIVKEGDEIFVKVISIDELGRINLSRRAALKNNNKRIKRKNSIYNSG